MPAGSEAVASLAMAWLGQGHAFAEGPLALQGKRVWWSHPGDAICLSVFPTGLRLPEDLGFSRPVTPVSLAPVPELGTQ